MAVDELSTAENKTERMALEGLIGSGKSTLSSKLEACDSVRAVVLREHAAERLLALFYADPGRYGFAMQLAMLHKRNYQAELLRYEPESSRADLLAWDRSKLGDLLFALLNHLLGSIRRSELLAYLEEFGCLDLNLLPTLPFLSRLTHAIFLLDDPERCRLRVLERGNSSERDIPLSYFEALEDAHLALLLGLLDRPADSLPGLRVLCLAWGMYDLASQFLENVKTFGATKFLRGVVVDSSRRVLFSEEQLQVPETVEWLLRPEESSFGCVLVEEGFFDSQARSVERMRSGPWKSVVTDPDAKEFVPLPESWKFFDPPMRRFLSRALAETLGVALCRIRSN